ncbi:hypothetical protein G1K37_11470 [Tenacibaculum dicentrarchi]|nr:hypothetical protein [Tenacibaculum dicentrarchi]
MTEIEIAEKYVYGKHDAFTDSQEIEDMAKDILEFAETYNRKQIAEQKELIDYKISADRKDKEANIMSWGVSFWLVIIIVFVFLLAVRACS